MATVEQGLAVALGNGVEAAKILGAENDPETGQVTLLYDGDPQAYAINITVLLRDSTAQE